MNSLFSKPLDIAFYTGIAIIILQFVVKRLKPTTKEKVNNYLKSLQTGIREFKLGKLLDNFPKQKFFMLIVFLNGLILSYLFHRLFQYEMVLDGKEAPTLRLSDLTFIGCLMIITAVLEEVRQTVGRKKMTVFIQKVIQTAVIVLQLLTLIIIVLGMYDVLSHFLPTSGIVFILEGFGTILILIFFSILTISLFIQFILRPVLWILRHTYVFLFPTDGDALDIIVVTTVSILGIIKTIAGYI